MNVRVMARRLRVFRHVKEHMELYGECPTAGMVAEALGIARSTASDDLSRIRDADGLPLPVNNKRESAQVRADAGLQAKAGRAGAEVKSARSRWAEPSHAAPVDLVMSHRRHIPAWATGDDA